MLSKLASAPPATIAIIVWAIQTGVAAGGWTLTPILSWGLFAALILSVIWFVAVWVYRGVSWLGNYWAVPNSVRWIITVITPVGLSTLLFLGTKLPPLADLNCTPIFEWRKEVKRSHNNELDMPVLIKFAKLIPRSPQKYAMIVKADGGDLGVFYVDHQNKKLDPKPWQLTPSGIGYKAIDPSFDVGFVMTARHPDDVQLNIEYECVKNVTR